MKYLNEDEHNKWVGKKLPLLQNKLYGESGQYLSKDSGKKLGGFPIIDTVSIESGKPVFSSVVKLTTEAKPDSYEVSDLEKEFGSLQGVSAQIIILQVDKDLNLLEKGHYPLSSTKI